MVIIQLPVIDWCTGVEDVVEPCRLMHEIGCAVAGTPHHRLRGAVKVSQPGFYSALAYDGAFRPNSSVIACSQRLWWSIRLVWSSCRSFRGTLTDECGSYLGRFIATSMP
ncbi:hypothetical protein [Pseudomonas glycinae]|uniref:hypothetical protein n=1 Tax=Pseudomonas glycinae TaxID=1785145 RepID=UPI00167E3AB8|nr:hypothetical protein [Pseudomonas glycinae]